MELKFCLCTALLLISGISSELEVPQERLESTNTDIGSFGSRQSPINIQTTNIVSAYYPFVQNTGKIRKLNNVTFSNTGTTFKINPASDESRQTISGGPLQNETYSFVEMHFHWGDKNSKGSEHQVNGRR